MRFHTFNSLVLVLLFHLGLYIFLFALNVGLLIVITQLIISDDVPYLNGRQSPLDLSPGLGIRPLTSFKTALIAYRSSDMQSWMHYVMNIRTFMQYYEDQNLFPQESFADCQSGTKTPDSAELACKFRPVTLGPCVKENNFGFDRMQPCILVKINRIYGWVPDITNATLAPQPLLRCFGQSSEDTDVLGELRYYPNITTSDKETLGYFDHLYFPYLVQVAYRSPIVAVQLVNPKRNVIMMMKCRLENVADPGETVAFEVLID